MTPASYEQRLAWTLAQLQVWMKHYRKLDTVWTEMTALFGVAPESKSGLAMWDLFEAYTDQLDKSLMAEGWLAWFIWENAAGAKGMDAKAAHQESVHPIRTLNDLAELICAP